MSGISKRLNGFGQKYYNKMMRISDLRAMRVKVYRDRLECRSRQSYIIGA